jgi:hypothetical protein
MIKRTKYQSHCEASGITFVPIVFDHLGAINEECRPLLRCIWKQWCKRFGHHTSIGSQICMLELNVTLMRGIAGICAINALAVDYPRPSVDTSSLPAATAFCSSAAAGASVDVDTAPPSSPLMPLSPGIEARRPVVDASSPSPSSSSQDSAAGECA